jgi:hypothetical protein
MQRQTHRRRSSASSSIWEVYAEYLLGELKDIGKMIGIIALAVFLLVSMLVGVYHVTIYMFWILWNSI